MSCLKMQPRLLLRSMWLLALAASLLGCTGSTNLLSDTLRAAVRPSVADTTLKLDLDPNYRYLRATLDGRVFLLYLGFVDTDSVTNDSVQVWYSGQGEVIRLKNGRIVSITGVSADVVVTNTTAIPSWMDALKTLKNDRVNSYERKVDVKEAYRFGVSEQVNLQATAAPGLFQPAGLARQNTQWMQENYISRRALPPSFFALTTPDAKGEVRVYYARQCVSRLVCLELQEWTLEDHAAQRAKERR